MLAAMLALNNPAANQCFICGVSDIAFCSSLMPLHKIMAEHNKEKSMSKLFTQTSFLVCALTVALPSLAEGESRIPMVSKGVPSVQVELDGKTCLIKRNAEKGNMITEVYAPTGQGTPQPMTIAPGVETLGEIEFIEYMKNAEFDDSILVLIPELRLAQQARIPCTTNVSYKAFGDNRDEAIFYLTEMFEGRKRRRIIGFYQCQNLGRLLQWLPVWSNPIHVQTCEEQFAQHGLPTDKLKYYRGGMQASTSLGLTVEGKAQ